eukprot:COSAG01_NODE_1327_length_10710_cov_2074.778155_5_plen_53_part_00
MKSTGECQTGLISRKPGRLISIHTGAFRAVGILRRKGSASGPTVSKVDTPLN